MHTCICSYNEWRLDNFIWRCLVVCWFLSPREYFVCLFVCLFVSLFVREYFTHLETFRYRFMLCPYGALSKEGSLSCHICCGKGPRFWGLIQKTTPIQTLLTKSKGFGGPPHLICNTRKGQLVRDTTGLTSLMNKTNHAQNTKYRLCQLKDVRKINQLVVSQS